ncbi:MAG: 4Fe-4S dicluster domain-containing protein [Halioglobus sp.]|nr:4Fe-4S dicluster domain-containing protein [Halioglobus sp.]
MPTETQLPADAESVLPIIETPAARCPSLLLADLLAEQQELTAVDEFSRVHAGLKDASVPLQAKYYSRLLPATVPGPGQQYAFDVDLDRCSGCKACVVACHSLNGLDEQETWRDVGLLIGGTKSQPVMQHVTTSCHHCLEPACMQACPVDAYEKDPVTGIVRHLDDQCFGCQYCTLACPYDVPKYHSEKGIVRKCDMCSDRLAVGEAPACVQSCPHEAISIRTVDVADVLENAEADSFLPAAPEPHLTFPTTTFHTRRVFPRNMLPADYYSVNPQHPHWPLILMLVLTQLSVGAFAVGLILESLLSSAALSIFRPLQSIVALGLGLLALAASTLLTLVFPKVAVPVAGALLLAIVGWLLRYDIVRATVRQHGLPRYVAVCLFTGYAWLVVTGLGWILGGPRTEGALFDATTHAVFLGFVITMIMAHAPLILPAVLRVSIPYHPALYAPMVLLQLGLLLRLIGGDAWGSLPALQVGGAASAVAIVLFAVTAAAAGLRGRKARATRGAARVAP